MLLRGAPRYIRGEAAGPYGVISLLPEAEVGEDGQTVRPTAIIALLPGGLRRYEITARWQLPRLRRSSRWTLCVPAPHGEASGAVERIVAGEDGAAEDPRISAAFGPTQHRAAGAEIALSAVLAPGGTPTPLGTVTISAGRITILQVTHGA
ncbi:MAG: hypothetical protein ACR2M0_14780 [Chloroflexia bacterium]